MYDCFIKKDTLRAPDFQLHPPGKPPSCIPGPRYRHPGMGGLCALSISAADDLLRHRDGAFWDIYTDVI